MKTHLTLLSLFATTSLIATAGCSDHGKDADPVVHSTGTAPAPVDTVAPAAPAAPAAPVAIAPGPAPAPEPVAVTVAAPATPGPFVEMSAALDKSTLAQTAALAGPQQNMDRAINARIEIWKASGATSTTKAEEGLALARTDFAQKLSALSAADDTTWQNAKSEALNSLESLQKAYRELLAGPVKN
jgi:hypothetical protein